MAPKYKLTYFNATLKAEPIRLILSYGGLPFEDDRFEFADWPRRKKTTPLGQVPVLEIDGKQYTQTFPLCRYLATSVNLSGNDPLEMYLIDHSVEMLWDVLKVAYEYLFEKEEPRKTTLKEKLEQIQPIILEKLNEIVKINGYIALERISWADLLFLCSYEDLENITGNNNVLANYPYLQQLIKKILEIKNIREYIQNRPPTTMGTYDLKSDL